MCETLVCTSQKYSSDFWVEHFLFAERTRRNFLHADAEGQRDNKGQFGSNCGKNVFVRCRCIFFDFALKRFYSEGHNHGQDEELSRGEPQNDQGMFEKKETKKMSKRPLV